MSQHQQHHHQQQQKPRPDEWNGITYYLICDEDPDRQMALDYLESKSIDPRGDKTRAVTELQLERLTDRHRVIVLYRRSDKDKSRKQAGPEPGSPIEWVPQHQEIRESEPIKVADFWSRSQHSEFVEGTLNTAAFLGAISARITPAVIRYRPHMEPGVLRVKYS